MAIGAPGCYGSVLSYDLSDEVCGKCQFSDACGESAFKSLQEIRKEINSEYIEEKFYRDRIKRGHSDQAVIKAKSDLPVICSHRTPLNLAHREVMNDDSLPKKPRVLIGTIFRKGMDGKYLAAALNQGVNPFSDKKPKILETMCDHLLAGGFSKVELRNSYQNAGMTSPTANSQVSIVVSAFKILGVIDSGSSGRITIRRSA